MIITFLSMNFQSISLETSLLLFPLMYHKKNNKKYEARRVIADYRLK